MSADRELPVLLLLPLLEKAGLSLWPSGSKDTRLSGHRGAVGGVKGLGATRVWAGASWTPPTGGMPVSTTVCSASQDLTVCSRSHESKNETHNAVMGSVPRKLCDLQLDVCGAVCSS